MVTFMMVTQEDMVASSEGHVSATPGAWLSVILIILAFVFGTIALIEHSIPLWIATGVATLAGTIGAIASHIMDQAY